MKKMISTVLLAMVLLGSLTASAYQGVLVENDNGISVIQPLKQYCEDSPTDEYCFPRSGRCPEGWSEASKYCWGGWKRGFYRCGPACRDKRPCEWGDHSDRCGGNGS